MFKPSVFDNRGKIVFASEPPGIVLLRDEQNREYVSTDKDLAARVQGCTLTNEILVTFVAYEVGSSRAAICVRLDIEEIHDDDPSRWLNPSDSKRSEDVIAAARLPGNEDKIACAGYPDTKKMNKDEDELKKMEMRRIAVTDGNEKNCASENDKVWFDDPESIDTAMRSNDLRSMHRRHHLLNKWWFIPSKLNKTDYPYPCNGIVVPVPGTNEMKIVSHRVGSIIVTEDYRRFGKPLVYFFVIGDNEYRSFEYSEFPCSMISATPVVPFISAAQMFILARGYAVISPSTEPENTWQAWNDQCGWMSCEMGCAAEMRKIDPDWKPLCHLIRFEAVTQGGHWKITNLLEVDVYLPRQINYFPTDLYFITDVRALRKETQENGLPVFVSTRILEGAQIAAEFEHVHLGDHFEFDGIFCLWALVFVTWQPYGREFRAIAIATPDVWRAHGHLRALADTLVLHGWNDKRKFIAMQAEPIPPE